MTANRLVTTLAFAFWLQGLSLSAIGQTGHVYYDGPTPAGTVLDQPLVPLMCGKPSVPQELVNPGFTGPVLAPSVTPVGGHAIDQVANVEYYTDGLTIIRNSHPLYGFGNGAPCPSSIGLCPNPGASPAAPTSITFGGTTYSLGPITGMAIRQQAAGCPKALMVTDGTSIVALTVCPPYTAVCAPFPAPMTFFGAIITGLECHLQFIIATDRDGYSYVVMDPCCGGGIFPIVIPPRAPLFVGVPGANNVIGNVFDRGNFDLWVTDGTVLVRTLGLIGVLPLTPPAFTTPRGASFSAEPLILRACGVGAGVGTIHSPYKISTTEPIVIGKTLDVGLDCPPAFAGLTAALMLGDCVPNGVLPDCSLNCLFWLNGNAVGLGVLDASGDLCLPVTIPNLWGASGFLQWAIFDPNPPCVGFHPHVSDAMFCRISYE